MAASIFDLNFPKRHLSDPIDAFQMDREIREIKDGLANFPILAGEADPEGNVAANVGALYLKISEGDGQLYQKKFGQGTSTGWAIFLSNSSLEDGDYFEFNYSGGTINLGTAVDGSFLDVDVNNAAISFDVDVPGRYKVECDFSEFTQASGAGVNYNYVTSFRLSDGTNFSQGKISYLQVDSEAGSAAGIVFPWNVQHVFNFEEAGTKIITLQKKVLAALNLGLHNIQSNVADERVLTMRAYRIAS